MVSRNLGPGRSSTQTTKPDGPCGTTMTDTSNLRKSLYYTATALSLSLGWGIRGNFGHEYGAMIPGRWRPCPQSSCRRGSTGTEGSPTSPCSARWVGRSAAASPICRWSPTRTRGTLRACSTGSPASSSSASSGRPSGARAPRCPPSRIGRSSRPSTFPWASSSSSGGCKGRRSSPGSGDEVMISSGTTRTGWPRRWPWPAACSSAPSAYGSTAPAG